jgi:chromosome segregation and condensation protein ScpB
VANQDIRLLAAGAGVKLWQIAEALGIADCSLSRKLRRELDEKQKQEMISIIKRLEETSNDYRASIKQA